MKELWAHQKHGIDLALKAKSFGWFFEAGTGKTRTAIETLRHLYIDAKVILPTLILCPPVVIENWRQEILKFSKIPPTRVHKLVGTGKQRLEILLEKRKEPSIFIGNYEALTMKGLFDELYNTQFDILICDESHRIKNPDAKRTKACIQLADRAKYKFVLSGTPVLRNLMDVWAQFRVLDGGDAFGKNFFVFRSQYFYNKNAHVPHLNFPDWRIRPNAECLISDMMKEKSMSVKKEDCLDLPPLVKKKIYVEMGSDQARAYKEMKKDFVTYINSEASSADLAITKALRLQQIVSGYAKIEPNVMNPEGSVHRFGDVPRTEALKELLEDLAPNHKVIVWACFKENYAMIREVCESLELGYIELHGEISQKKRDESIVQFREDEKIRVVIGNQGAAGIGINLVEASYMVYFSRNFSLEQDIQSEARSYRSGSEIHSKVTRIDIVCENTIDDEVLEALANKQAIGEQVLREIAGRLK